MAKRKSDTFQFTPTIKKYKPSTYSVRIEQNEDGSLKSISQYLNNRKHGLETIYDSLYIAETIQYRHGKKHGYNYIWYDTGFLKYSIIYVNGKKQDSEKHYDNNSMIYQMTVHNNEKVVSLEDSIHDNIKKTPVTLQINPKSFKDVFGC